MQVRPRSGERRPTSAWRQNGFGSRAGAADEDGCRTVSSGHRRVGNRSRPAQNGGSWRNQKEYHTSPHNAQRGGTPWRQDVTASEPSKAHHQVQRTPAVPPKQGPIGDIFNLRPQRPGTAMQRPGTSCQRPPLAPKAPSPQPAGMPGVKRTIPSPTTRANATNPNLKAPPAFLLKGDAYTRRQAQIPKKHSWLELMDLEEEHGYDFTNDHIVPWVAEAVAKEYARSGLLARWARQGAVFRAPYNRLI